MSSDNPLIQCWHTEPYTPCDWNVCRQPERLAAGDIGTDPAMQGDECIASISGHCLRETLCEGACNTDDGECVYGSRPAEAA